MGERTFRLLDVPLKSAIPDGDGACVDFVAERMVCPLVLDESDHFINDLLQSRWLEHLQRFETEDRQALIIASPGGEAMYYSEDGSKVPRGVEMKVRVEVVLQIFDESPRDWAITMNDWYARARPSLLRKTVLLRAPVATKADHSKHFPKAGSRTDDAVRRDSTSGISYFQHRVDASLLHQWVRQAETERLDSFLGVTSDRIAMDCHHQIGWVQGKPSQFIAIEWTTGLIHSYPVSEVEARALPLFTAE